jgi:SAM-dependent methyltransferase
VTDEPAERPANDAGAAVPGAVDPARPMDHIRDPRELVRVGYDLASHAYRGDDFDLDRTGYGYWLGRLAPLLADGARVLDLGCGNGVPVARELAKRCAVTGVDLSAVQVERARALVPGARFVQADMSAVEFSPGSFDAVVAFYSIFNLPLADQPGLIERVAGWLVPGGRVFAVVGKVPWTGVEKDWRGVPGVRMYYSQADAATYRRWFEQAGFTIETEGSEPRDGRPGYAVLIARRG